MPATTPIFGLPYPTGADRPCDGAAQVQALAQRYNDLVGALDADLGRVRTPLAATVSYRGPDRVVKSNTNIVSPWTVVEQDVGGWANLGVFADRLFFPRTGRYVIGVELLLVSHAGLPSVYVGLEPAGLLTAFPDLENGGGNAFWARASAYVHGHQGGFFRAIANDLGSGIVEVRLGSLWGFWTADE